MIAFITRKGIQFVESRGAIGTSRSPEVFAKATDNGEHDENCVGTKGVRQCCPFWKNKIDRLPITVFSPRKAAIVLVNSALSRLVMGRSGKLMVLSSFSFSFQLFNCGMKVFPYFNYMFFLSSAHRAKAGRNNHHLSMGLLVFEL